MTDLQRVFEFNASPVRTIIRENEPWFVANDVCEILGISNPRDAVARLPDDEKGVTISDTLGGGQEVNIINEPGVYRLIFRSNKPEAEAFKRWVFHEVLPSIRKTGAYILPEGATVADVVKAVLPFDESERLTILNATSDQVAIGFPFHDDKYLTVKEASKKYRLNERNIWFEIRNMGLLELVYCRKNELGCSYPRHIERLSEKGRQYGEEVFNYRSRRKSQPFSFRWLASKMPEILKIYMPMILRREELENAKFMRS